MSTYSTISPEQLKLRLDQGEPLNIIDVREDEEVAAGMIPGAKHIPLGQLPERYDEIEKTPELFIMCRSGGRSSRACEYLSSLGFEGVTNITGGMLSWEM
ncbi:rhodanese-like domain-containing protein [Paenibacillus gansuensis]|uniref:Rhodanese-like domain-containing protein n=1 Tax=Paenibacillus gansuensis TaxID=306542 RepID=A0ABW5PD84_9BACL